TEVTRGDYFAFLIAVGDPDSGSIAQPVECSWNTSFEPTQEWPPKTDSDRLPVVGVDWCDARAYCSWAGKRLCGKRAGVTLTEAERNSAVDMWHVACAGPGGQEYPYGSQYEPTACNGPDLDAGAPLPVKSSPHCEGGYSGLFDMSGNVAEWIDACQATTG